MESNRKRIKEEEVVMKKNILLLVVIAMVLNLFGLTTEALAAPTLTRKEEGYAVSDTMIEGPTGNSIAAFSGGSGGIEEDIALMRYSKSGSDGLALVLTDPLSALLGTDTMNDSKDGIRLLAEIPRTGNMSDVNSTRIKTEMDPYAQTSLNEDAAGWPGPGPKPTMEVLQGFNPSP